MQTKVVKIDPAQMDESEMEEAAKLIREGELVAFPTETVYGLGADALHPEASKKIYAAKGRPSDNPLIVHICRFEELESIAREVPPQAKKLADAFWPGPLTMIVWKNDRVPYDGRRYGYCSDPYAEPPGRIEADRGERMSDRRTECEYIRQTKSDRGSPCGA